MPNVREILDAYGQGKELSVEDFVCAERALESVSLSERIAGIRVLLTSTSSPAQQSRAAEVAEQLCDLIDQRMDPMVWAELMLGLYCMPAESWVTHPRVTPVVFEAADHYDPGIRMNAVLVLGLHAAGGSTRAYERIKRAANDPDLHVRENAASHLKVERNST